MEEEYQNKMLEYILVTQVLILANQLRSRKRAAGEDVTSDMIPEAARLIEKKSQRVFDHLDKLS